MGKHGSTTEWHTIIARSTAATADRDGYVGRWATVVCKQTAAIESCCRTIITIMMIVVVSCGSRRRVIFYPSRFDRTLLVIVGRQVGTSQAMPPISSRASEEKRNHTRCCCDGKKVRAVNQHCLMIFNYFNGKSSRILKAKCQTARIQTNSGPPVVVYSSGLEQSRDS